MLSVRVETKDPTLKNQYCCHNQVRLESQDLHELFFQYIGRLKNALCSAHKRYLVFSADFHYMKAEQLRTRLCLAVCSLHFPPRGKPDPPSLVTKLPLLHIYPRYCSRVDKAHHPR
jgi:hypothetical protein